MKKSLIFLSLALLIIAMTGCHAVPDNTGVVNPWQETTVQELKKVVGNCFIAEKATDAVYRLNRAQGIAETMFTDENGIAWCCRVQKTDVATDISGMYYDFGTDNAGYPDTVTVGDITLTQLAAVDGENIAYVAYYYDGEYTVCFSALTAIQPIVLPL